MRKGMRKSTCSNSVLFFILRKCFSLVASESGRPWVAAYRIIFAERLFFIHMIGTNVSAMRTAVRAISKPVEAYMCQFN